MFSTMQVLAVLGCWLLWDTNARFTKSTHCAIAGTVLYLQVLYLAFHYEDILAVEGHTAITAVLHAASTSAAQWMAYAAPRSLILLSFFYALSSVDLSQALYQINPAEFTDLELSLKNSWLDWRLAVTSASYRLRAPGCVLPTSIADPPFPAVTQDTTRSSASEPSVKTPTQQPDDVSSRQPHRPQRKSPGEARKLYVPPVRRSWAAHLAQIEASRLACGDIRARPPVQARTKTLPPLKTPPPVIWSSPPVRIPPPAPVEPTPPASPLILAPAEPSGRHPVIEKQPAPAKDLAIKAGVDVAATPSGDVITPPESPLEVKGLHSGPPVEDSPPVSPSDVSPAEPSNTMPAVSWPASNPKQVELTGKESEAASAAGVQISPPEEAGDEDMAYVKSVPEDPVVPAVSLSEDAVIGEQRHMPTAKPAASLTKIPLLPSNAPTSAELSDSPLDVPADEMETEDTLTVEDPRAANTEPSMSCPIPPRETAPQVNTTPILPPQEDWMMSPEEVLATMPGNSPADNSDEDEIMKDVPVADGADRAATLPSDPDTPMESTPGVIFPYDWPPTMHSMPISLDNALPAEQIESPPAVPETAICWEQTRVATQLLETAPAHSVINPPPVESDDREMIDSEPAKPQDVPDVDMGGIPVGTHSQAPPDLVMVPVPVVNIEINMADALNGETSPSNAPNSTSGSTQLPTAQHSAAQQPVTPMNGINLTLGAPQQLGPYRPAAGSKRKFVEESQAYKSTPKRRPRHGDGLGPLIRKRKCSEEHFALPTHDRPLYRAQFLSKDVLLAMPRSKASAAMELALANSNYDLEAGNILEDITPADWEPELDSRLNAIEQYSQYLRSNGGWDWRKKDRSADELSWLAASIWSKLKIYAKYADPRGDWCEALQRKCSAIRRFWLREIDRPESRVPLPATKPADPAAPSATPPAAAAIPTPLKPEDPEMTRISLLTMDELATEFSFAIDTTMPLNSMLQSSTSQAKKSAAMIWWFEHHLAKIRAAGPLVVKQVSGNFVLTTLKVVNEYTIAADGSWSEGRADRSIRRRLMSIMNMILALHNVANNTGATKILTTYAKIIKDSLQDDDVDEARMDDA